MKLSREELRTRRKGLAAQAFKAGQAHIDIEAMAPEVFHEAVPADAGGRIRAEEGIHDVKGRRR